MWDREKNVYLFWNLITLDLWTNPTFVLRDFPTVSHIFAIFLWNIFAHSLGLCCAQLLRETFKFIND